MGHYLKETSHGPLVRASSTEGPWAFRAHSLLAHKTGEEFCEISRVRKKKARFSRTSICSFPKKNRTSICQNIHRGGQIKQDKSIHYLLWKILYLIKTFKSTGVSSKKN
jgi:hypothetical protein